MNQQACQADLDLQATSVGVSSNTWWLLLAIMVALPGCQLWQATAWTDARDTMESEAASHHEGEHRVSKIASGQKQAVQLSVRFHHATAEQLDDTFWSQVDEAVFPPAVRQAWLANGLRVGVMMSHQAIDPNERRLDRDPVTQLLTGTDVIGAQSSGEETISLRAAQLHQLPMGPGIEGDAVVLVHQDKQTQGRTLDSPQLTLELTPTVGLVEGMAHLQIQPTVFFGPVKQQFIGSEAAVRIHAGRDAWPLNELDLDWDAEVGAKLIIAPAVDASVAEQTYGLGHQMLRDQAHLQGTRIILAELKVVRISAN